MEILKTTPAQLRSKAGQISSLAEAIAANTEKMFSLVSSINGSVWSGSAQTAYKSQFEELRDDAQRMKAYISDTSENLLQIAQEYEKVEEENEQIARSLATDIIQ